MKKLLYVLVALLVLTIAAILVAPSLIDWNTYRDEIAARVERATGRAVTIDGDLNLTILPSPAISANGVRIANLAEGSAPALATLKALRVKVRLAPLLQGRVQVEQVILVEPRILLEVLPDGHANWHFGDPAVSIDGAASEGAGLGVAVRLDQVRIVDGTLIYRDHRRDLDEQVRGIDAEIAADSLRGPFAATGALVARDVPLRFDAGVGRYNPEGPTRFQLELGLDDGNARVELLGTLDVQHAQGPVLAATLEADGDNLARALRAAKAGSPLPPQLAQAFAVSGKLNADRTRVAASGLDLRLGETSADGIVEVDLGETPKATTTLRVQRLDLDDLLAMTRDEPDTGPPPAAAGFAPPTGLDARLDLRVDALVYRGQVVRQGRAGAVLEDGVLTLERAMALLPGGSDVTLSGKLVDGPRFDGRVEAASDNLRAIFDWLGVTIDDVPAGRLRRMNLLADVNWTPAQVTLTELNAEIDTMQVGGAVAIAPRQRLGLGIGLSFDRLNLDAYLPERDVIDGEGAGTPGTGALAALGAFDANFDLKAGALTWRDETARDLSVQGTLQHGRLTLREARIGDLVGSRIAVDGSVDKLAAGQPALDMNLTVESRKPAGLAALFRRDITVPADLGTMTLSGNLKGDPAKLAVDLTFDALDGLVQARGELQSLPGPTALDLAVTLRHPELADLLRRLPDGPDPPEPLGGVDLAARIAGTPLRLQATELRGEIGPVTLSGMASLALDGERPAINANLETGDLPVQALAGPGTGAPGAGGDGRGEAAGTADPGWSDEPLGLSALRTFDGELTLDATAIVFENDVRLDNAVVEAALTGGVLNLDRLEGVLAGGKVQAAGTIDAGDDPAAGLRLRTEGVDIGPLLVRGFAFDRVSGPLTLTAEFNATGGSERALVRSLTGDGRVDGTLTVKAGRSEQMVDTLLGLLGEKVKELRGLADTSATLLDAFAGKPAALSGSFTVRDGVARTSDTVLQGQGARALLRGRADLPNWRTESRIDLFRAGEAEDEPYMTTLLRGPLDAPTPSVRGAPFRAPTQRQPTPREEREPAQPSTETIIKDVLERFRKARDQ